MQEPAKKDKEFIVSVSPHVKDAESTRRIMWTVSACLLPALLAGAYFFGPGALMVTAITIASCMLSELLVLRMMGKPSALCDGSAFLTGLLLGMNLPPTAPIYIPIIGGFIATGITKQLFGGLGFNIFNPALIGRAFVLITWPRAMTTWSTPEPLVSKVNAATMATPLGMLKEEGMQKLVETFGSKAELYKALLIGNTAGSLGETSAILIIIGGLVLLAKRYITWHIPVSFLATVALLAWVFGGKDAATGKLVLFAGDPIIHLLSGGLMLGAFFMATDYVTAPTVRKGQLIFGIGCGAITMLIRLKGGFPEGVMFAILLMNCFTPIIDSKTRPATFGLRKEAPKK